METVFKYLFKIAEMVPGAGNNPAEMGVLVSFGILFVGVFVLYLLRKSAAFMTMCFLGIGLLVMSFSTYSTFLYFQHRGWSSKNFDAVSTAFRNHLNSADVAMYLTTMREIPNYDTGVIKRYADYVAPVLTLKEKYNSIFSELRPRDEKICDDLYVDISNFDNIVSVLDTEVLPNEPYKSRIRPIKSFSTVVPVAKCKTND
jgi:hypothetical protein